MRKREKRGRREERREGRRKGNGREKKVAYIFIKSVNTAKRILVV